MRILIVGDWTFEIYEGPLADALAKDCGAEVHSFRLHEYFGHSEGAAHGALARRYRRLQHRFALGPGVSRANHALVLAVSRLRPDLVFIRSRHIWRETVLAIKRLAGRPHLTLYTNDNPFSGHYPRSTWRHYVDCVPEMDLVLAYRPSNIADLRRAGAKRTELFRAWFVPGLHYPISPSEDWAQCDVSFVGHYEDDGRLDVLEALSASGLKVRVFGPGWDGAARRSNVVRDHRPIRLGPEDYRKVVCSSTVALCFLSTLNGDSYTRRCFEIPAMGGLLLSQRTSDQLALLPENESAFYFLNAPEAVTIATSLSLNHKRAAQVALSGQRRVWQGGHDVTSRSHQLLDLVASR